MKDEPGKYKQPRSGWSSGSSFILPLSSFSSADLLSERDILQQGVAYDVDSDLDGVLGVITGAGDRCLTLHRAAQVVLAVDHAVTSLDLDPLQKGLPLAQRGVERIGQVAALRNAPLHLADVEADTL